jgi:hypothetical protein
MTLRRVSIQMECPTKTNDRGNAAQPADYSLSAFAQITHFIAPLKAPLSIPSACFSVDVKLGGKVTRFARLLWTDGSKSPVEKVDCGLKLRRNNRKHLGERYRQ